MTLFHLPMISYICVHVFSSGHPLYVTRRLVFSSHCTMHETSFRDNLERCYIFVFIMNEKMIEKCGVVIYQYNVVNIVANIIWDFKLVRAFLHYNVLGQCLHEVFCLTGP